MVMKRKRMVGAVIFALGAVVLAFAYHASNARLDQLSSALTGRFADQTMWYFVLGAAAVFSGALLALFGKRI
jgi:hypothetical protein